jgi:hypothetical protein
LSTVVINREVAELLRDSPELLAIADAIAATQATEVRHTSRRMRLIAVAAVIAVAVAVALVSPWQSRGSGFVGRALAALGSGEVVHVVSVSALPDVELVDPQTRASAPIETRTEIWFDGTRSLERVVSTIGGRKAGEVLQTPAGTWSDNGPVYTCAWIAAHPVEATKARVSCNANGVNGTTPRRVAEPVATLDPSLSGFVSGYRDALQSGEATRDGNAVIDGREVEWLRFDSPATGGSGMPASVRVERVAVDQQTLKPVLIETSIGGRTRRTAIATIETLAPQGVAFTRPKQAPADQRPAATSVTSKRTASIDEASTALHGRLVWAGPSVDTLQPTQVEIQKIVTGYGISSGIPFTHSTGVEMVYGGPVDWGSSKPYVVLRQSLQPEMLYGFDSVQRKPPSDGRIVVSNTPLLATAKPGASAVPTGRQIWRGLLEQGGVYVAIEAPNRALLLDAARQLSLRRAR